MQVTLDEHFAGNSLAYSFSFIEATPDRDVKSCILVGDSITIGWSSTDSLGDRYRNFGIYERGIKNRCGVLNLGSSGITLAGYQNTGVYAKTYAMLAAMVARHKLQSINAIIACGTNDAADDPTLTYNTFKTRYATMRTNLAGMKINVATILPRRQGATITAISKANPAVITAANSYVNGDLVYITGVAGMTQINGLTGTVSGASGTGFSVTGIDSTLFSTYTSGGLATVYSNSSRDAVALNHEIGGIVDLINDDIRSGAISSDDNFIDGRAIFEDPAAKDKFYLSEGYNSYDYVHPNLTGLGWAMNTARWLSYFDFLTVTPQSYMLDSYTTNLKGAFGLRRLNKNYTGAIVDIVRASDSVTRTFYAYLGNLLDAEIDMFLSGTTGVVSRLYDQSGNSYHATQGTAGSRPAIAKNIINSRAGITFDGVDDYLSCDAISAMIASNTQNHTLIGIYKRTSIATQTDIFSLAASSNANALISLSATNTATSRLVYRDNTGVIKEPYVNSDDTSLHTIAGVASFSGSTYSGDITRDNAGTHFAASGSMGAITIDTAAIGAANSNASVSRYFSGNIQEILAFNTNLDADTLTSIYINQKSYWDLP